LGTEIYAMNNHQTAASRTAGHSHESPILRIFSVLHRLVSPRILAFSITVLLFLCLLSCQHAHMTVNPVGLRGDLDDIEKEIGSVVADPQYPDDPFVLVTVKEALQGGRERNGAIGACLVREETGEVIEKSHNRQYEPYFRSDLHAEMDLLDRYEEKVRLTRSRDPKSNTFRDPRNMKGLILYTSVEPCPMCMTRIINAGIKKVYYAASDPTGGMASRFEHLPPFWKGLAEGMVLEPARCSPALKVLAQKLFRPHNMFGPVKN
jgi:tRNA(adenine34) deaminase